MTSEAAIRPQPGPQEVFLSSAADIAIYGGAAGGGKTFAILLEGLRHGPTVQDFYAVYFRRNTTQVKNPGGLWDESVKIFPHSGAKPVAHVLEWRWAATNSKVKFSHLEHEQTKLEWQGSQIPLICFDELTHFSQTQFFYLMSRNRSMSGVSGYIRATCNPDADSWVAEFIAWWIDQTTGFPIQERSGVIRWFVRLNDRMHWADTKEELITQFGNPELPEDHEDQPRPKSVTFVPAKLTDNPALLKADPNYLSNLKAQNAVEQARLLGGNWKIRPAAGLYFKREWVTLVDTLPLDLDIVRYWDLAATPKTETNDPDWTVGAKLGRQRSTGRYFVINMCRLRETALNVKETTAKAASHDGKAVSIGIPQDPGQAGKGQATDYVSYLNEYMVRTQKESGDKIVRFGPFSSQCQAGNVSFVRGLWNSETFAVLEGFPDATHDDDVDALSGAYDMLTSGNLGLYEYYRAEAAAVTNAQGMQDALAAANAAITAAQQIRPEDKVKAFIGAMS